MKKFRLITIAALLIMIVVTGCDSVTDVLASEENTSNETADGGQSFNDENLPAQNEGTKNKDFNNKENIDGDNFNGEGFDGDRGSRGQLPEDFDGQVDIPEGLSDELKAQLETLPAEMQYMLIQGLSEEITEEEEAMIMEKIQMFAGMEDGQMPQNFDKSGRGDMGTADHHNSGPSEEFTTNERIDLTDGVYADGTYTGTATGYQEGLEVTVTIENNAITELTITDHNETPGFYEEAFEQVPEWIMASQSTDVDTVSGATRSSEGIILAVEDALNQALVN